MSERISTRTEETTEELSGLELAANGSHQRWAENEPESRPAQSENPLLDTTDSVRYYLNMIGRIPLLSAEEEVGLSKRMSAGTAARKLLAAETTLPAQKAAQLEKLAESGERAKDEFIEANLRLVVSIAKRYRGLMEFMDLIQYGSLGLNRAVEKFDPAKGYKFSTYASWWIRQSIQRGLADGGESIRKPSHVHDKLLRRRAIRGRLLLELGREPTEFELAEEMEMSLKDLDSLLDLPRASESLDSPIGDDQDATRGDLVASELDDSFHDLEQLMNKDVIRDCLENAGLGKREKAVIIRRNGFNDEECATLEEIGQELGLSRERIRQIERGAMQKLRNYLTARYKKEDLLSA